MCVCYLMMMNTINKVYNHLVNSDSIYLSSETRDIKTSDVRSSFSWCLKRERCLQCICYHELWLISLSWRCSSRFMANELELLRFQYILCSHLLIIRATKRSWISDAIAPMETVRGSVAEILLSEIGCSNV